MRSAIAAARRSWPVLVPGMASLAATGPVSARIEHPPAPIDWQSVVNPELRPALPEIESVTAQANAMRTIEAMVARRAPEARQAAEPLPPGVVRRVIPGVPGAPPVTVYVVNGVPGTSRPAILHLHGGGFVLGRPADAFAALLHEAALLDCTIVTVDYRRPPEAPFPAALDDGYAGLTWLHDHAAALGVDPSRIAVQGESAGGGLAAMLAIAARDRGTVKLVHQSLVYPMLDDRTGSTSEPPGHIGTLLWTRGLNNVAWSAFLGRPAGGPDAPHGAVPARIDYLRGLAPAFIGVGSIDLFVDEDITYARHLIDAGVPADLLVVPGAYHGFDVVGPPTALSRRFRLAQFNALALAFGRPEIMSMSDR